MKIAATRSSQPKTAVLRCAGARAEVPARHDAVHENRQFAAEDQDETVGVLLA
jgi:hypothetical protein